MKIGAALVVALLALAGEAHAQGPDLLHVKGHAWETGGFPASDPGDDLNIVGILRDIHEPLTWDSSNHSYTLWIRDLVSLGEIVVGTTHVAEYAGGLFTIYVDSLPSNHDYGINPPNATAPSTFMDGTSTYLEGFFWDFHLVFNDATASGAFVGSLEFTGGDVFPLLHRLCWTFGANVASVGPEGYDLEMDGDVFLSHGTNCGPVPVASQSWGRIKSLYR